MIKEFMQMFSNNVTKDEIAEVLRVDSNALKSFEESYSKNILNQDTGSDLFSINSRQASDLKHSSLATDFKNSGIEELEQRIVAELISLTEVYTFDGKAAYSEYVASLPSGTVMVSSNEIMGFPEEVRPQLAGNLMKVDISQPSYTSLIEMYIKSQKGKTSKERKTAYNMFRQGLDILDLDEITYQIIGTNPNSMGNWFPQLVEACAGQEFFKIPATKIAKVPISLLQLTRQDYMSLSQTTLNIVDMWAKSVFQLDEDKEYFIKTGTYSSKFDFRNAYVHGPKEVNELGEYLLYIHYQALQMASPLSSPTIYGVSTTNEWVVRDFIHDKEGNPCIYKGLPLHTEYRVFVDCDTDQIIGVTPYWEPNTMKQRFGHSSDSDSPHNIHDYVIYKSYENLLMDRYNKNKDLVLKSINQILPHLDLRGQWSIDIMQNDEDFWIIDMAIAENSAFYECVPKELRNPIEENWIPDNLEV